MAAWGSGSGPVGTGGGRGRARSAPALRPGPHQVQVAAERPLEQGGLALGVFQLDRRIAGRARVDPHPAVAHPAPDALDALAVCLIEAVAHAQDASEPPDQAALAAVEASEVGVGLLGERAPVIAR